MNLSITNVVSTAIVVTTYMYYMLWNIISRTAPVQTSTTYQDFQVSPPIEFNL